MIILALLLLVLLIEMPGATADQWKIRGEVVANSPRSGPLLLFAIPAGSSSDKVTAPITKPQILRHSQTGPFFTTEANGEFELVLDQGKYHLFAFLDLDSNGRWDPATSEPFGWYSQQASGTYAVIQLDQPRENINITVTSPTLIPQHIDRYETGGRLSRNKGFITVELKGDARTRGLAHGKLLGPQILDFFRFYFLEDKMQSAKEYESGFAKFLHTHFVYPEQFRIECEAIVEGMKLSGMNMLVPELQREFTVTDLYAINGYIETRAMRSSCTQFAAWGERTVNTDVAGGMITGRNMDGEIDLRRVTVSHFVIFAVTPTEPQQHRYVSMMWPGFVSTISGMNEHGLYTMENAGNTRPGPVVEKMTQFGWVMRDCLASLDDRTSPQQIQAFLDRYDNSAGGICGPGCINLFAAPYHGQTQPAFIFEGDRFGDAMRFDQTVPPLVPNVLVASNHHRLYGVDPSKPDLNFGSSVSFNSRWRYEAGMHKLESWFRTGRQIGTAQMQELLQTVAHGTTEYAIITRPNQLQFDVAVATMRAEPWDAPYCPWTTFEFQELFVGLADSAGSK